MFPLEKNHRTRPLHWAIVLSLMLHGGLLFLLRQSSPPPARPMPRIEARLGKGPEAEPVQVRPPPPASAQPAPSGPSAKPRVLAVEKSRAPAAGKGHPPWSTAQKEEMERFLEELASQPRERPDLARQSRAMARELGSRQNRQEEAGMVALERLPDSPPIDSFSLEMYVEGLLKKLNRSAAFVRNDPRGRGLLSAAVQIRLNPDGSLKTFEVINAGDQKDEIAFVRSVVAQAVPFPPFPPDLRKSAQSLAMTICILPAGGGGGGFGFSRSSGGQGC